MAMRILALTTGVAVLCGASACTIGPVETPAGSASSAPPSTAAPASPAGTRLEHVGYSPVETGEPIDVASLTGRIVFDNFEDVYAMNPDGSNVVTVAGAPGPEFDGAWSADGRWVVYRDSTRGTNNNDEIYIAAADGSSRRNLSNDPENDWGPDWSHDGSTIAFNSTRDGAMHGYLVKPDGSKLRRIASDAWIEYPSFSPDDSKLAFMGVVGSDYSIYVIDLATAKVTNVTDFPGEEGWPVWSPDGSTIAFSTQRDDCRFAARSEECWRTGDIGPHHDVWLVDADGSNPRRVTPEFGQFVAWSPDGQYLLISGTSLYVVRPDGTGRVQLHTGGISGAGIPDWR
jgi:Tol biopolymer transport system component